MSKSEMPLIADLRPYEPTCRLFAVRESVAKLQVERSGDLPVAKGDSVRVVDGDVRKQRLEVVGSADLFPLSTFICSGVERD